jgi:hypothetical protein
MYLLGAIQNLSLKLIIFYNSKQFSFKGRRHWHPRRFGGRNLNTVRDFKGTGIRLESNKNGRMGSSSKPYTGNYNNRKTIKNKGLYKFSRIPQNCIITEPLSTRPVARWYFDKLSRTVRGVVAACKSSPVYSIGGSVLFLFY